MHKLITKGEKKPPNWAEDYMMPVQIVCTSKGKTYVK